MKSLRYLSLTALLLMATTAHADSPLQEGKQLYEFYCAVCHGMTGDGWGINAAYMQTEPADHTASGEMGDRSNEELFKSIKYGGKAVSKSALMPRWGGNMTDQQIHGVIAYIRSLCCNKDEQ